MNVETVIVPIIISVIGVVGLEVYRDIKAVVRAQRDKRNNVKSIPQQISDMNNKLDRLAAETTNEFKRINDKLSNDREHFNSIDKSLGEIKNALNRNADGTILCLENDAVIFKAFRENKINGESEAQEKKMEQYYARCAESRYKVE